MSGDTIANCEGKRREQWPHPSQSLEATGWVILFYGGDGDWEWHGGTQDQAKDVATCSGRHMNYGRDGYSLIRCEQEPQPTQ